MKKQIIIILLCNIIFLPVLFSQVKWLTIQEAIELNKKNPKHIIIDVYTDWCGWCKRMDAVTFSHPVIATKLNKDFYAVKFNAESLPPVVFNGNTYVNDGRTHQFASALLQGQLSYPSMAFLNPKLQLLGSNPGFKTANELEPLLDFLSTGAYNKMSYEEFTKTFISKIQ